jgi:proteasome lid subunit RPN8/RPN11
MGVFEIDSDAWALIEKHARKDYPDECCGLLAVGADELSVVHGCENIQNKLHELDPVEHPRMAKTAYRMDDLQVSRILTATEDASGKLSAIYHSHIDCGAYFSEEDQTAAQFDGEPAYPELTYLVVSVVDGKVDNGKAFSWSDDSGQFDEVPLTIV